MLPADDSSPFALDSARAPGAARRGGVLTAVLLGTSLVLALALVVGQREGRAQGAFAPDDDAIIAEVPARRRDPMVRAIDRLGQTLARQPRDVATATELAELALQVQRRSGDPRFLGRAQAALAPWWQDPVPPAPVLLLRATIKQSRHDFDDALVDLDRLSTLAPDDEQAWLIRAVVLTVRGRYHEALASCRRLPPRRAGAALVATACAAPAEAALGHVGPALAALERAVRAAAPAQAAWGHSVAGEIAFWAGQRARAETHLRRALALAPTDSYSRVLLADLLLDGQRAGEVVRLLEGSEADDGALLRLALAHRQLGKGRAPALIAELAERFEGARRRGDLSHAREEARFALGCADDPPRALALALENWTTQHEPWDARLVLAAAAATGTSNQGISDVAAYVSRRGGAWAQALP
jgi:tetratricopeptide (TPR) repeat protein